jgi:hypothetical protein
MITKDTILDFFSSLKENDEFNENQELLWGYFFLDSNSDKLLKLSKLLEAKGYGFVDIFEAEKENEEDIQEYYLHMEKVEIHDVSSLLERNNEFYEIASNEGVNSYDGFDAGNVP